MHQFKSMSESIDHVIGMFCDNSKFILGGYWNLASQISFPDLFQNDRLIVEKNLEIL